MADYSKSKAAERDLIALWKYIAEGSEQYAEATLSQIERTLELLA